MVLNNKNTGMQLKLTNFIRDCRVGNLGGWSTEDLKEISKILEDLHDSLSAFGELFELSRREVMNKFKHVQDIIHIRETWTK